MSEGTCDRAFGAVREVFDANLASGADLGAGLTVFVNGRCVVELWGGVADKRSDRAWDRATECVTFSCTKAVTATAALLLTERGLVSLSDPVTSWWPEFGAHGKDTTTGEQLLSHQAGLPAFDRPITPEQASDPAAMAAQLAGQTPQWIPGTDHGYHAVTFGWLVGELVRRLSGMTVGEFVRGEFGPDLWIGVPASRLDALARISGGGPMHVDDLPGSPALVAALISATQDPDSPTQRSMTNPAASFNNPVLLTGGWPAAGLIATSRALADFYSRLVAGEILAPDTLRDALRQRVRGPDRTLITESAFGLGFMLPCSNMYLPLAARATAFGHPGASGALGLGDLDRGVAIGFIPNLSRPALGDRRAFHLVEAVYSSL
ncbi:MAG: serine hydrolase domain-containing protein [Jatrophihabitantaceae bacterium]